MRQTFLQRLIHNNAQFLAKEFRKLADQLDAAAPGKAVVAFPLMFQTPQGDINVSDIQVQDDSAPLSATASFLDARGNPTTPGGTPTWTSSDESVATVAANEDGMTGTVTIVGGLGAAQITCTDPESTDDSSDDVIAVGTVSVVPGRATVGNIEFAPTA